MYLHAIDASSAVLLGIYAGRKLPQDIEDYAASVARVDAIAHAQGRGALIVIVPDREYPSPNSSDRLRFAFSKDSARSAPTLLILVTRSPLLRGVMTAVNWLSPPTERWHATACASFLDAQGHAREFREACAEPLARMEHGLRLKLAHVRAA